MAIVVKVECEGELRRVLLEELPSFRELVACVRQLWPSCEGHRATYMDEDGDACSLTDSTFTDFLASAGNAEKKVLRLRLSPVPNASGVGPASTAATPVPTLASAPAEEESPWEAPFSCGDSGAPEVADMAAHVGAALEQAFEALSHPDLAQTNCSCRPGSSGDAAPWQDWQQKWQAWKEEKGCCAGAEKPWKQWQAWKEEKGCCAGAKKWQRWQEEKPWKQWQAWQEEQGAGAAPWWQEAAQGAGPEEDDVAAEEKVLLILAAFDEDGDGRLNFQEWSALVKSAWGFQAPPMAYHFLCAHLGLDAEAGLDADHMAVAYAHSGTLDWDFQAAKRKLEGPEPQAAATAPPAEPSAPSPPAEPSA